MSTELNLEQARRWYEAMWSLPDYELADELVHPDYDPDWVQIPKKGPEQVRHEMRYFRGMFPDLRYQVIDCIAQGARVWVRYRGAGTQAGSGWGFEATGRLATFEGVAIFDFDGQGRVTDRWGMFSSYDMFTSLGLAPPWWELSQHLDYESGAD
jgi:predicted ester cyclase